MDLKIFKKFSCALFIFSLTASAANGEGMEKAYDYGTDNPERQERAQEQQRAQGEKQVQGEQRQKAQDQVRAQKEQKQARFEHKVIEFGQNETQLSEDAKKKLQDLVNSARASGEIQDIKVAAWSDKEFPPRPDAAFTEQDQNLAEKRLEQVKKYVDDQLNVTADIDTYNMGEEANVLAKLFNTDAAELKSALAKRGAAEGLSEQLVQTMKDQGGPSKAVVVVKNEERAQGMRTREQRTPTVPGGQTGTEGRDADAGTGTMNDGIPDSGSPEI